MNTSVWDQTKAMTDDQLDALTLDQLEDVAEAIETSIEDIEAQLDAAAARHARGFSVETDWVNRASGALARRKQFLKRVDALIDDRTGGDDADLTETTESINDRPTSPAIMVASVAQPEVYVRTAPTAGKDECIAILEGLMASYTGQVRRDVVARCIEALR
jgi:hypothetical protein